MKTPRGKRKTSTAIIFAIGSLLPAVALAQIQITEVMYDAPGSDSGREWIEIANLGSETIDIGKYKLFENNTNHGLKLISGAPVLVPNATAVIASDAQKFLADYPAYSGTLFDSAFALSNTGESFSIKNGSSTVLTSIEYSAEETANGTGGSLQFKDGSLVVAMASPGLYPGLMTPVPKKAAPAGKTTTKKTTTTPPSKATKNTTSKNETAGSPAAVTLGSGTSLLHSLPDFWLWLFGLGAIILAGVGGLLFVLSGKQETLATAEEFNIE